MGRKASEQSVQRTWDRLSDYLVSEEILVPGDLCPLVISDDPSLRDTPRHYGATELRAGRAVQVLVHEDALGLPGRQLLAILLHEMGHVIDAALVAKGAPKDSEQRADWHVRQIFGVEIRYDDRQVQTLGEGRLRPEGLR